MSRDPQKKAPSSNNLSSFESFVKVKILDFCGGKKENNKEKEDTESLDSLLPPDIEDISVE